MLETSNKRRKMERTIIKIFHTLKFVAYTTEKQNRISHCTVHLLTMSLLFAFDSGSYLFL